MASHALCDLTDLIVTWSARDRLPKRGARTAMAIAGASTLAAAGALAGLQRPRSRIAVMRI
jgi:hypothetical protein